MGLWENKLVSGGREWGWENNPRILAGRVCQLVESSEGGQS